MLAEKKIELLVNNCVTTETINLTEYTFNVYSTENRPFLYDTDFLKISQMKDLNSPNLLYESPEVREKIFRKVKETGEFTDVIYLVGNNPIPIRMDFYMTRYKIFFLNRCKYHPENQSKSLIISTDRDKDLIFLKLTFPISEDEYIRAGMEFDKIFLFLNSPTFIITVTNPEDIGFADLNDLFITSKRWSAYCKRTKKIKALIAIVNKNYFSFFNTICVSSGGQYLHYAEDISDAVLISEAFQNSILV